MTELFQRIPEEKRKRIIKAALDEFAAHGFDHANINTLAIRAGVSVGSLYQYFQDKEDLFLTVVNLCTKKLWAMLEELLQSDKDSLTVFSDILRTLIQFAQKNSSTVRLYNELTASSNERLLLRCIDAISAVSVDLNSRLVERLQNEGKLRAGCDPGMFAFLLSNLMLSLLFSYSCGYYRECFKKFAGENILSENEFVIDQTLRFIRVSLRE